MKTFTLLIFAVLLSFVSEAKSPEYVPPFKIISDTLDPDVPEGKCLITGVVTYNEKTVNEATVKAYNYDKATGKSEKTLLVNSDKLGKIRMLVDTSTYFLTAWKPGTGTAYVENVKFKSGHHIIIEIYLPDEMMDVVEKPVVYLYNDRDVKNVSVQVATDNEMLFTYPRMNEVNEWNVKVGQEGIKTQDGRSYPYLFWEAGAKGFDFYSKREGKIVGEVIQTDSVISYLENKLYSLHLNSTEVTDFITYWGPRLQQKDYALIQFKIDQEVDEIAQLNVSPQPDWSRRVYMVFSGFESMPNMPVIDPPILEEGLEKRTGFHVLEWGGSEIQMINELP